MKRKISIFEKILKKYMYSQLWIGTKLTKDRKKELMFSSALACDSGIFLIFLICIAIIDVKVINKWSIFYKTNFLNKIISFIIAGILAIPGTFFFYKRYKIYYDEFIKRAERKKRRKEKLKEEERKKYLKEYCLSCNKSFKEVKRYANTNLCINCFNKELKNGEK